jgi:hypothetical protein
MYIHTMLKDSHELSLFDSGHPDPELPPRTGTLGVGAKEKTSFRSATTTTFRKSKKDPNLGSAGYDKAT